MILARAGAEKNIKNAAEDKAKAGPSGPAFFVECFSLAPARPPFQLLPFCLLAFGLPPADAGSLMIHLALFSISAIQNFS